MASFTSDAAARKTKARRTLLTILAICVAPFVAAAIVFNFFPTTERLNYGDLMELKPLPDVPKEVALLQGTWVLLHFDSGACDTACEKKLFSMRQTRTAQGREMDRVERVWVLLDGQTPAQSLEPLYNGVHRVKATSEAFRAAFPATGRLEDGIYLLDPLGNLILRFPADADARRMMKDLKRLLQVSRIG